MEHNIFALAGLLHGINKLGKGALTSRDFVNNHKQKFINGGLWNYNDDLNLASILGNQPRQINSIISLAAFWSSGLNQIENNINIKPLYSVFNKLSTETLKNGIKEKFGYQPGKYNLDKYKPVSEISNVKVIPDFWQQFENDFKLLPDGNSNCFIYSFFHLLKIYGWFTPWSSAIDYPDCSLFEYLKTTGAFAHCIATYISSNPESKIETGNQLTIRENHYPLLMVCGDISGIQNFIYNITNKNAMKSLKGRSFFIQLLTESIAKELLDCCGATIINQVYGAGGKFYLLLPNTTEVNKNLENYKKNIQLKLWDSHKGKLTCNISSLVFTMKSDKGSLMARVEGNNTLINVGELWSKLAEKTAEEKRKKFAFIINERYAELFTPQGKGGKVQVCDITSEELKDGEVEVDKDDENKEIKISKQVRVQIEIGQKVNNAKYLVGVENNYGFKPGMKIVWDLVKNTESVSKIDTYINIGGVGFPQMIPGHNLDKNTALGFKIFGGIENPTNDNGMMSLEELCRHEDGKSIEKLGILRMDVDNLGNLFMNGFTEEGKNKASFSSLATLSALLEHFFGGYINVLRNREEFKNHINIVYSGGDDVFAVGRWDRLILFAIKIREKFKEFVCNREDITISAGIAIINHKFPIAKGAEIAGEMEDIAKRNVTSTGKKKDSITLFGIPLNWQDEMPFVVEFKNDLVGWLSENAISKGLMMKIFSYYEMDKRNEIEWQWQCAYAIARSKGSKSALDVIKTLIFTKSYYKKSYNNIPFANIQFAAIIAACRWAELEFRSFNK